MGSKKRHFINNDEEKNSFKNKNQYELEFFQFVEDKKEKKDNFQDKIINKSNFNAIQEKTLIIETDLDKIFEQKLNFLKSKKINLSKPNNIDDFIKQTNEIPLIIPKFEKTQEIDIDALLDSEISDVEENNLDLERIPKENTLKNTICNNLLKLEKNNFFEHKIFTKNGKTTFSASPEPFFQNSKSHFEDLEKTLKEK